MLMISPYVGVEPDERLQKRRTIGGIEIELENQFNWNKREINVISGWVTALPNKDEIAGYPMNLKIGDYIYFHFQEIDEVSSLQNGNQRINFKNVYCRIDEFDNIEMCNDFILLEREWEIVKVEEEILKSLTPVPRVVKMIESHGVVKYKPNHMTGIDIGDRVFLKENSHYVIRLSDKTVYLRVRERDIIATKKLK
jgi:hypothetical protein